MAPVHRSILLVLAAGVLFGTAGTAQALGGSGSTPLGVGALRILTGAVVLLVALPLSGGSPRRLLARMRAWPMLVTAAGAAAYQPLFFGGVGLAGVALGTLVAVGSGPVLAGLLAWTVLGHRPSRGWFAATAISVAGLALLAAPGLVAGNPLGLVLAVGAGLASASFNVAAKLQLERGTTGYEVTAGSFLLGGAFVLPLLATQPLGWVATPAGLALVAYLGIATMAVANLVLALGMRHLAAGPTATLMLADPVVATLLGVVVLAETIAPVALLGVVLVLAGLLLQAWLAARVVGRVARPAL